MYLSLCVCEPRDLSEGGGGGGGGGEDKCRVLGGLVCVCVCKVCMCVERMRQVRVFVSR